MIPFFDQPVLRLGPLTVHAFGAMVALGILVGGWLALRWARRRGLDDRITEGVLTWTLVAGFVGAHLFSVLFYFPDHLARDPWLLIRIWQDLSSFGAFAGGLVGIWLYFRVRQPELETARKWAHTDSVGFAIPFAWALGRLGCTLAHDHPGRVTSFFLGRSLSGFEARRYVRRVYEEAGRATELPSPEVLSGMAFHDLGWYEFLFLALAVVPLFLFLNRRERPRGFFTATFLVTYCPVRFVLDFLRVGDATYAGLTPAQYLAVAGTLLGAWIWRRRVAGEGGVAAADGAAGGASPVS